MIPYNEREVLKLLQEESTQRKGFEMIVGQYSEQLYWQIRRMVLSHEDANDLLQNTFIKAWTNIDYFRAEAKLSTWHQRGRGDQTREKSCEKSHSFSFLHIVFRKVL